MSAAGGPEPDAPSSAHPPRPARILLAEDCLELQQLISHFARKSGVKVVVVGDGEKAVEAALVGDFALVLMDINMPVMGGLAATRLLRSLGFLRPIIAVSTDMLPDDVATYMQAGFTDCIPKPIDLRQFHRVLETHLKVSDRPDSVGDSLALREIGREFVAGLPAAFAAFEVAARKQDYEALRALAHRMKGTAGFFEFPELGHAAGRIEAHVRAGEMSEAIQATREMVCGFNSGGPSAGLPG